MSIPPRTYSAMDERRGSLSTRRIESLSDSIFAVAMTVLILDIHSPLRADLAHASLSSLLFHLSPKVLSYIISFMVLGIGWSGHHHLFHHVKRSNRYFLWMNIVYLMGIVFIPFSTSLLGEFGDQETAILVFGLNLNFTAVMLYLMWSYAASNHRLIDSNLELTVVRLAKQRILSGILLYFIIMGVSFFSTKLSLLLYLVIPIFYILPGKVDRHFAHSD